jgi:hypothetical protein
VTAWRRPGPYVAYPDDRAADILATLAIEEVGLDAAAWSLASRYLLDGKLSRDRLRRIRGWTAMRQARLVEAGFWRIEADEIVLVGYLAYNHDKATIRKIRDARSAVATDAVAGRQRDSDGMWIGSDEPDTDPA